MVRLTQTKIEKVKVFAVCANERRAPPKYVASKWMVLCTRRSEMLLSFWNGIWKTIWKLHNSYSEGCRLLKLWTLISPKWIVLLCVPFWSYLCSFVASIYRLLLRFLLTIIIHFGSTRVPAADRPERTTGLPVDKINLVGFYACIRHDICQSECRHQINIYVLVLYSPFPSSYYYYYCWLRSKIPTSADCFKLFIAFALILIPTIIPQYRMTINCK